MENRKLEAVACLVSLLRKGSVSTHHCWPLEKIDEYERVKKLAGPGNISNLVVGLVCEWLRKQEGREPPKISEAPRIFTTFEELGKYLDNLSIEELAKAQGYFHRGESMAKERWQEKKHPRPKKQTFLEQIEPFVGAGLRQIDTSNLESK